MTKVCTVLRLKPTDERVWVGEVGASVIDAAIVDVSVVEDDHTFGLDAQGLLHVEGKIVAPEIRIGS